MFNYCFISVNSNYSSQNLQIKDSSDTCTKVIDEEPVSTKQYPALTIRLEI